MFHIPMGLHGLLQAWPYLLPYTNANFLPTSLSNSIFCVMCQRSPSIRLLQPLPIRSNYSSCWGGPGFVSQLETSQRNTRFSWISLTPPRTFGILTQIWPRPLGTFA
jgi:hypothetical protein